MRGHERCNYGNQEGQGRAVKSLRRWSRLSGSTRRRIMALLRWGWCPGMPTRNPRRPRRHKPSFEQKDGDA